MSIVLSGYLALGSNLVNGALTEITTAGYYRQPVSFGTAGSASVARNTADILFGPNLGPFIQIAWFGLYDAPTGGNLLGYWQGAPAHNIAPSRTVLFSANTVSLVFGANFFLNTTLAAAATICQVTDPILTTPATMIAGVAITISGGVLSAAGTTAPPPPPTLGVGSLTVLGGTGLAITGSPVTTSTGQINIQLAASGVSPGTYSNPTLVVDATGRVSGANNGVLAANGSNGLTVSGSPAPSGGTLGVYLTTTGVAAGTYSYPVIAIDLYGRVQSVQSGSSPTPVSGLTSVAMVAGAGLASSGSPLTRSGAITIGLVNLNAPAGTFVAATIVVNSNGFVTSLIAGPQYGYVPLGPDGLVPTQYLP